MKNAPRFRTFTPITKKTVPCNKEYNTGVRIMVIGVAYINVPNENIKILHNDNNVTVIISLAFNLVLFIFNPPLFFKNIYHQD